MQEILVGKAHFTVAVDPLLANCETFAKNRTLIGSFYFVRCSVSAETFSVFLRAVEGSVPVLTDCNVSELRSLSEEFGFSALLLQIQTFQSSKESFENLTRQRLLNLEEQIIAFRQEASFLQEANYRFLSSLEREQRSASELIQALLVLIDSLQNDNRALLQTQVRLNADNSVQREEMARLAESGALLSASNDSLLKELRKAQSELAALQQASAPL
jgi:hypothetical protein